MARNKSGGGSNKQHDWAAQYGWSLAFLKSHPALHQIFTQAINNTWSPQRFIAEIQDTKWFKSHQDSWRKAEYLQATDPATYKHQVSQIQDHIANAAGSLGIEVNSKTLNQWAQQALRFGWTDDQINNHLASQVQIMGAHDTVGGNLATTMDNLNQWALQNGVDISKHTMQGWLQAVVRGDSTMEEYKQYITKQAVAANPNWSKELGAGMSLSDIADPYRNSMAQLLEVNPNDINVNDPMLKRALSYKDEKGDYQSMSMYDFQDAVRQDPRWLNTDNAKAAMMDTGSSVLKMFGVAS